MIEEHHKTVFFTIKLHISNDLCEDLDKARGVSLLYVSSYEHLNVALRRACQRMCKQRVNRIQKTSCSLESNVKCSQGKAR